MFRYTVRYRRSDSASRVYRMTVTAKNAEDARRAAAIRDPGFASTTQTPRRLGAVVEPEMADGLTAAKGREWVAVIDGGRHGDIEVEVV